MNVYRKGCCRWKFLPNFWPSILTVTKPTSCYVNISKMREGAKGMVMFWIIATCLSPLLYKCTGTVGSINLAHSLKAICSFSSLQWGLRFASPSWTRLGTRRWLYDAKISSITRQNRFPPGLLKLRFHIFGVEVFNFFLSHQICPRSWIRSISRELEGRKITMKMKERFTEIFHKLKLKWEKKNVCFVFIYECGTCSRLR